MSAEINSAINSAVRTGKVSLGAKSSIRLLKSKKISAIILAKNCPDNIKEEVLHLSKIARVPVFVYSGTNFELGGVCEKPFPVSVLSIIDPGSSNILELIEKEAGENPEQT